MLAKIPLDKILFLDIETVPAAPDYHSLPQQMKALWNKKANLIGKPEELPEEVYEKAGIYAEFGKIVCISVGLFRSKEKAIEFRVKSFYGNDEKEILNSFFPFYTNILIPPTIFFVPTTEKNLISPTSVAEPL